MALNIPESPFERIVIVGAGFAGYTLAKKLAGKKFQIVLLDRNNYHQFQPLFYQVGMAGLEPSSICFPLRKSFQSDTNFFVRVAEVLEVNSKDKKIITSAGIMRYDKLVLAMGAKTNYYGNAEFESNSIPLKSVSEALYLRNRILGDLEKALMTNVGTDVPGLLDIVIVGGGPTGVEIAGALAELKNNILPRDYPDLDSSKMHIHLIQSAEKLLPSMSLKSSLRAEKDLKQLGVQIHLNQIVDSIKDHRVHLKSGNILETNKVIWAAGVSPAVIPGIPSESLNEYKRYLVDENFQIKGLEEVYAIGDIACYTTEKYQKGHPQVAAVALQQADWLANFFKENKQKDFEYFDKGQLATIGRNKAVVDIGKFHFEGFFAWITWLFVHIYFLIGVRNKIIVLLNWLWAYIFYDQALRLIIKPYQPFNEK
ncbi:MAG: NAD(P)/FAD-dependent oxidoreductase [Saprospiraceae bacterium]